jgi:hypothetical protein
MPTSSLGYMAPITVASRASNKRIEQINPHFVPDSFLGSNAPKTVPSQSSTTHVQQIKPNFSGGYDKDTIYVVPSFEARESDDDDSEPEMTISFYIQDGRRYNEREFEIMCRLRDETSTCEQKKKDDIATLGEDEVASIDYLATLVDSLRQHIPPSSKIQLLDANTHDFEMVGHGFRFPEYSDMDLDSDEEDYEDGKEDLTYHPEQSSHMSTFAV